MNIRKILKPRIKTIGIMALLFIATVVIPHVVFYQKIPGGTYYLHLPFACKIMSCAAFPCGGSACPCNYDWVWPGVIASIVFWIVAYAGVSWFVNRKP